VDRRTAVILAVAVTAVVAISISAATLTSTVEPEGEGSDSGLPGEDSQFGLNLTDDNETESSDSDPSGPWRWVVLVFVALAVVSALFAPRQTAQVVAGFVGLVAVVWLLMLIDIEFALDGDLLPWEGDGEGGTGPGTGGQNELQSPLVLALIAFASVAVLGVLLLSTRRGGDAVEGPQDDDEEETEEGDDTTALGSIAGRAADRIEADDSGDRAATNEVYRAWREMTAALDPDDAETVTPREFQHHAIAAGMSPDDVRELTRLFEQVRYGGEPVTADREERAVRVLRRIESTYGERS
jgi:hypothetical protein